MSMASTICAGTIFPALSLNREKVRWEDYLETLTPVEAMDALRVKREDYFAPLGPGGINGGKVRQLLWVLTRYLTAHTAGEPGVLMGGSVRSPMVGRVATVARHLGMNAHIVLASDAVKAAEKYEDVRIAQEMGATFSRAKVGYNPALQRRAKQLHETDYRSYYLLEYALSVAGSAQRIEEFYRFCSGQLANMPDDIETLLVPAGSCNTTLAILYGIARLRPRHLQRVLLFGIAPARIAWYEERLGLIEQACGQKIGALFAREYPQHPDLQARYGQAEDAPYKLAYHDLHKIGYTKWEEERPASIGEFALHPRYEGKVWSFLLDHADQFPEVFKRETAMLWVVGGESSYAAMRGYL